MASKKNMTQSRLLFHVAGSSGSGKSFCAEVLNAVFGDGIIVLDLDDINDYALRQMRASRPNNLCRHKPFGNSNDQAFLWGDHFTSCLASFLYINFKEHPKKPTVIVGHNMNFDFWVDIGTTAKTCTSEPILFRRFFINENPEKIIERWTERYHKQYPSIVEGKCAPPLKTHQEILSDTEKDSLLYFKHGYQPHTQEDILYQIMFEIKKHISVRHQ